jgi:tripartite-type tricarboxylate transporter receptor subunit TctC
MRLVRSRTIVLLAIAVLALAAACEADEPVAEEPVIDADDPEDDPEDEPAEEAEEEEEAPDEPEEAFYDSGDTVRYIVPTSPGGGADAIAQFLNPYWNEHIPGNPSVSIDHVSGAGGTAGSNEWWATTEDDGLQVLQGTLSSATAWLLGEEQVRYDMGEFQPVLAFSTGGMIYIHTDTGVESIEELPDHDGELIIGGRAPTASDVMHILAMEVLGVRDQVNHIWGYEGTGEQMLAFEQGEVNIDATTDNAWINNGVELEEAGLATPLVAYGIPDGEGGFERHPEIDAPTVDEAHESMYGEPPSGEAWDAFRTVMDVMSVATVVAHHPDAPQEAVDAWRAAVNEMVEETDFVEAFQRDINPSPPIHEPDELDAVTQSLADVDDEMRQWIMDFLAENYPDEVG